MMPERLIEFEGTVIECLAAGRYRVRFDNEHEIVVSAEDDSAQEMPQPTLGARVTVEISPDDMNSYRLIFRRKTPDANDNDGKGDAPAAEAGTRVARLVKARASSAPYGQHKFRVGDSVSYLGGPPRILVKTRDKRGQDGTFEVVRTLPNDGLGFQYRIKNVTDGLERIVVEAEIASRAFL